MHPLPREFLDPIYRRREVICRPVLDLTVYLEDPTEAELRQLIHAYVGLCPAGAVNRYKIAERQWWEPVPQFTDIEDLAIQKLAPRMAQGRGYEFQVWDGAEIDEPRGSWSLRCQRVHLRASGFHAFVRMLAPIDSDPSLLSKAARHVGEHVRFSSGHGGFSFTYNAYHLYQAFDAIYDKAKRFWCADVECLNRTLPYMRTAMKGVQWVTLVGNSLFASQSPETLFVAPIKYEQLKFGSMWTVGSAPAVGDRNRLEVAIDWYGELAHRLAAYYPSRIGDFPGKRFSNVTNAWLRRLLEPNGW